MNLVAALYATKPKEQVHSHHFVFGIPGMLLSCILLVHGRGWYDLIIAGVTAALFLSELRELLTQDWQP